MSENFDDDSDDIENDSDDHSSVERKGSQLGGEKNYITPAGFEKLKAEMHALLVEERPKLVETVAWAAGNGDRSENADYIYGKRRLREIDKRVRFLQKRIDAAVVVDPTQQSGNRVLFGATVTVQGESGESRTYQIVGQDESEVSQNRISWKSPIGAALLQAQEGDVVLVKTPKGTEELEVLRVRYAVPSKVRHT